MKGLYKKDFLLLWQTKWVLLIIGLLISAGLLYFKQASGLISFFAIFLCMQGVTGVLQDRISGWNLFQTTFPIARSSAIREKYNYSLLLAAAGFGIGFLLALLFGKNGIDESMQINMGICAILVFSVIAISVPLGILLPKSQYFLVMLAGFTLPALLIALWAKGVKTILPAAADLAAGAVPVIDMNLSTLGWMAGGCALLFVFSWMLAPKLLVKRDQL